MARLDETFNTNDLPEDAGGGDFTPLPAGDYNVTIHDAEIKQTKSGTGQYINLKLHVDGPTHTGRFLFGALNIKNDSAQAEQIGRGQLGSILRAIGIESLEDTDQLLGGTLSAKVVIKPASGQYKEGNEIKGYKALGDAPQSAPAPRAAAPAKPAPAAPAKAAPPWAKR